MAQTKKSPSKQLPPAKNKAVVTSMSAKNAGIVAKKVTVTSEDVKKIMMENQELRKENQELKNHADMLGKLLLTAGITVDEKFGDPEIDEVKVPSMKEVSGYKDVSDSQRERGNPIGSSSTQQWDNEEDEDMD